MRVSSHQSGLYEGVFALFSFLFVFQFCLYEGNFSPEWSL